MGERELLLVWLLLPPLLSLLQLRPLLSIPPPQGVCHRGRFRPRAAPALFFDAHIGTCNSQGE
jgi:hypothetical protein